MKKAKLDPIMTMAEFLEQAKLMSQGNTDILDNIAVDEYFIKKNKLETISGTASQLLAILAILRKYEVHEIINKVDKKLKEEELKSKKDLPQA